MYYILQFYTVLPLGILYFIGCMYFGLIHQWVYYIYTTVMCIMYIYITVLYYPWLYYQLSGETSDCCDLHFYGETSFVPAVVSIDLYNTVGSMDG